METKAAPVETKASIVETKADDKVVRAPPDYAEVTPAADFEPVKNLHDKAGFAVYEQKGLIPSSDTVRKPVRKREYWFYTLFSIGTTGVGIGNFGSAQQQNLTDGFFPNGTMYWGGQETTTTAFILDLNGIVFACQLLLLLILGPYADYGTWRPYILITVTIIGVGVQFGFTALYDPSQWQVISALFVLGTILYNVANSFYIAAFPMIVRDLPQMIESEEQVLAGTKSFEEHAALDTLERSKISNILQAVSSIGSAACIAIALGISQAVGSTADDNNRAYAYIIGFFAAVWLLVSLPWFFVEQYRAGQKLPDNTKMYLAGPKQVWQAIKHLRHLKQTFLYLLGYFLIVDCYSTTGSLVNILQNESISFSATDFSGLFLIVYGVSFFGYLLMYWVQKRFNIPPKWLFVWSAVWITAACLWGVIGIWTDAIGYHNEWEFWFYQSFLGLMTPGLFSYGPVMLSEVAPAPKMYLFFALYNSVGQTSTFIGPFITGAIINASPIVAATGAPSPNYAFWFTFATGLIAIAILCMVNVDKAKIDCGIFLEREKAELYQHEPDMQVPSTAQITGLETTVNTNRLHEL